MNQIQYIKHHDIDFKKWNDAVHNSLCPLVFAESFYLNATSPGWDALIINDYESIFPLTHKSKFGIRYLPQPPFTSQLGVYGKTNIDIEKNFYDYITNSYKLIDLEWNACNTFKNEFFTSKNTYVINYHEGYLMNKNTQRNIQKASQSNFKVDLLLPDQTLLLSKKYLYPFLKNELHLSSKSIQVFEKLVQHALMANQLVSFQVIDQKGNCKAIAHFIFNHYHAFFLKGTVLNKKENSGSMHMLLQHAIQYFSTKVNVFDFGGGSNSESLANFYHGLGGKRQDYGFLRWNNLPRLVNRLRGSKK